MKNSSPHALSFSKQRMVELARALMAEPELLLLDEPASGLDENEVEKFKQLLSTLRRRGLSILLVEHNMRLVMDIAYDIIVLNFGSKIAEGNPSEVAGNPEVIDAYLGEDHIK